MKGNTVFESWFDNLCKNSGVMEPEITAVPVIGILTFEVSTMMSKLVDLWQYFSENQMIRLHEEILSSPGIQKLISEDNDYLMGLVLAEILERLECVAEWVARHGIRCADPLYHHLDKVFVDPGLNWLGWGYSLKEMETKVKKMKRFVAASTLLFQEMEVFAKLEQNFKNKMKLLEFQQSMWQCPEVRYLRKMSPWVRTFDYTVRLLLRALITIAGRIEHIFGEKQMRTLLGNNGYESITNDHSSSVHPSVNKQSRSYSGPLGRSIFNLGLNRVKKGSNSKLHNSYQSSVLCGKPYQGKTRRLAHIGPFKGCMTSGTNHPVMQNSMDASNFISKPSGIFHKEIDKKKFTDTVSSSGNIDYKKASPLKHRLLGAPLSTLGGAALALSYSNVIISIEKIASSPHSIRVCAREDLYNMIPNSFRTYLSAKLKLFAKTLASSVYDAHLAAEWNLAIAKILDWLSPLAHNMIRWNLERNFGKQQPMYSGTTVLLVGGI